MAGGITGLLFGLVQLGGPGAVFPVIEAAKTGILLGLVAWVVILVVVGLWLHYGLRPIALPALLNALVAAVLTVLIASPLRIPLLDVWIGLLVGTLVGATLCRLCGTRQTLAGGDSHGLR